VMHPGAAAGKRESRQDPEGKEAAGRWQAEVPGRQRTAGNAGNAAGRTQAQKPAGGGNHIYSSERQAAAQSAGAAATARQCSTSRI